MLSRLGLKGKILTICFTLASLLLVSGTIGLVALRTVVTDYDHIVAINVENIITLSGMRFQVTEMTRALLRLTIKDASSEFYDEGFKALDQSIQEYAAGDKTYNDIPFSEGEQAIYDPMNAAYKTFLGTAKAHAEIFKTASGDRGAKMVDHYQKDLLPARKAFLEASDKLLTFHKAETTKWSGFARDAAAAAKILSLTVTVLGFALAAIIGLLFSRSLANAVRSVSERLGESGAQVSTASEQLSASSQQLSAGATEAASSLEETVASVEELSSMVKLNADHAREAASLSQASRESAESGEQEMKKLNAAMAEISDSSKKIEEIINVIDDIAFQTNLLALNAAVEAARAGEQGKGFAVVAEAVRNLAQRSAVAAKDITTLIKDSVGKIDRGGKIAEEGATALKGIMTSVKKVSDLNQEIATASQEQSNGLAQISKAMNELDQATQRNAASAEEAAAASEEMSSQAVALQDMVAQLGRVVDGNGHGGTIPVRTAPRTAKAPAASPTTQRRPAPVLKLAGRARVRTGDAEKILPLVDDAPAAKVGTTDGF